VKQEDKANLGCAAMVLTYFLVAFLTYGLYVGHRLNDPPTGFFRDPPSSIRFEGAIAGIFWPLYWPLRFSEAIFVHQVHPEQPL
jgi:hypothetical protein